MQDFFIFFLFIITLVLILRKVQGNESSEPSDKAMIFLKTEEQRTEKFFHSLLFSFRTLTLGLFLITNVKHNSFIL
jgi:hypothetical protein